MDVYFIKGKKVSIDQKYSKIQMGWMYVHIFNSVPFKAVCHKIGPALWKTADSIGRLTIH